MLAVVQHESRAVLDLLQAVGEVGLKLLDLDLTFLHLGSSFVAERTQLVAVMALQPRKTSFLRARACRRPGLERRGPTAVGLDHVVDLGHEADRLVQGDDDPPVMGDVLVRECAPLPVLEPLVADLIAADLEVPDFLGHSVEPNPAGLRRAVSRACGGLPGVEPDSPARPADAADLGRAGAGVVRDGLGEIGRLEKMEGQQVVTCLRQLSEDVRVPRWRNAGEVELEVCPTEAAVGRAVEHGVDPGEQVLGAKGGPQVAAAVRSEGRWPGPVARRTRDPGWAYGRSCPGAMG